MVHHFLKLITPVTLLLLGAKNKDLDHLSKARNFLREEFEIIKKLEIKQHSPKVPIYFDKTNQKELNELVYFDDELDQRLRFPNYQLQANKRMISQNRGKRSTFKQVHLLLPNKAKHSQAEEGEMYRYHQHKRSLLLHAIQAEKKTKTTSVKEIEKRRAMYLSKAFKELVLTRII